jgi:SSS family solute:Na+ symporter
LPDVKSDSGFFRMFVNWFLGVVLVYSFLFGTGKLIFGDYFSFSMYLIAAIISSIIIYKNLSAIGWEEVIK